MSDDGEVARLRAELEAAHKNRAMMYAHIFDAIAERFGAEAAEEVMKRAIYRRGREIGTRFRDFAPADLDGLRRAFLDFVPDQGRLFEPEVLRCDAEGLEIRMRRCPLKEAWLEAGFPPERVQTLCRIAGVVDNGTFEGAGFAIRAETWKPGEEGCCRLHIRPGAGGD
ncbi:MAG TPA: hypothetical protein ENJ38_03215 [Rhodospirillales bacterium]|nr:hypothetical protein [Rhodospirillales bacterium]